MKIVDCHAHFEPRMLELPRVLAKMDEAGVERVALIPTMNDPLPSTPETLLAALRVAMRSRAGRLLAEGVHRALLTPEGDLRLQGQVFQIYDRPDNDSVARAVAAHPTRFWGWIFLNPRNNPRVLDDLEKYRSIPGMIGIKLHPHWHDYRTDLLDPILRRAQELKLPALIHLGFGKRGDYRAMASRYPGVSFLFAHAGFPFYDELWRHARALRNVFIDLSSPYINEALARDAVRALGPERCLYGTDAPYGFHADDGSYDYGEIRRWVERMDLRGAAQERIFAGNFLELLARQGALHWAPCKPLSLAGARSGRRS